MKRYGHYIDGEFVAPRNGEYLDSIDPACGKPWCQVARGSGADIDLAVESAQQAFDAGGWGGLSMNERADCLVDLADRLERDWESLVEAEVRDNGKRIVEVRAQFAGLHGWFRAFAQQARDVKPETLPNQIPGVRNTAYYQPYGVVGVITPWNSPLMILAWKIGPALAAGNTVVVKPSEYASASTLEFAELGSAAGLPKGVLNIVTGFGHEAGEPLVRHRLTRKVTFTGSDAGGRKVAEAAAGGVIPTTLELGGKSPQLLFADADLDNALNGIVSGIFLSNGQTCVAGSRLLVEASIHDEVVERICARAESLRAGDPMRDDTQVAPLANEAHLHKVLSMIAGAREQGAACASGGERQYPESQEGGFYVQPTVFTGVTPAMSLWREEVFGPVLAVTAFADEDEAVRLANDSDYGLAAGIWSGDPARAERVAARIQAGTVYINHYRSVDPGSPIGGFKQSGYGRELGPNAVKDFLQVKSVWVGTDPCADPFAGT